MKKKILTVTLCFILFSLSACQSQKETMTEKYWASMTQIESLGMYVKEQSDSMDLAALQEEAASADSTLRQQLQATILLCEIDRQGGADASVYAESILAKVNTEAEEFAAAFDTAFYPRDCFQALFETAEQIDGNTLANLLNIMPEDSVHGVLWREAIDQWVERHPPSLLSYVEELRTAGYFDEWESSDWIYHFFYDSQDPYCIETDTSEDAIAYISVLRNSLLPELEAEYGKDSLQSSSTLGKGSYYTTGLAITVDEPLDLKEPDESNLPETIELEGRKVVAFYRNPYVEEFKDSPTALRILGDFMLGLSEEEYPKSMDDADYYLVLTPSYEYGDFYQITSQTASDVQQVRSSTSIDLYEAGTGTFLRHLGNVIETPPSTIFTEYSDDSPEYPVLTQADTLYFIYQNANTPEAYASLVDHLGGNTEFLPEEPVSLGGWEIVYHNSEIVESFTEGIWMYTADPGYQYARVRFTVTNTGTERNTFIPSVGNTEEDTFILLTDSSHENLYQCVDVITLDSCLVDTFLDPGESKEGELVFQLPEEIAENAESLYIMISQGYQMVFCPLGE